MTIQDIYKILDGYAPFSKQESYDNSGMLVGDPQQEVKTVLLTLDITIPVVEEAVQKHADLILAHHPVIWNPLRSITPETPVWHLVQHRIGAICSHTCFDIADGGLNDVLCDHISRQIPLQDNRIPLAELSGGRMLGGAADLITETNADVLASRLKAALGCRSLRYFRGSKADSVKRIAWCSGSGGDLIHDAIRVGADALITGDCKHSVWAEAQNLGFTLFDCGHFETEVIIVGQFRKIFDEYAPELTVLDSEIGTKPFFQTV